MAEWVEDAIKKAVAEVYRITPVALRALVDSIITTEIEGVRSSENKAESLANSGG